MGDFNRSSSSRSGGSRGGFGGSRGGSRGGFGGGRDSGSRGGFGGSRDGGSRGSFGGGDRDGGSRNFGGRDSFGGGRDAFGGRESGPREMFSAVCDACGKNCEVPFRPTMGKPIYCSDCFEKKENGQDMGRGNSRGGDRFESSAPRTNDRFGGTGNKGSEDFKVQYEVLNAKLDKILKYLEPKPIRVSTVTPEVVKEVKKVEFKAPVVAEVKAVAPKAVVKKTAVKAVKKVAVKKAVAKK